MEQTGSSTEAIIRRAFRTAHLLTASIRQAERAVLQAIDWFDPDDDAEEALIRYTVHAAVQGAFPFRAASNEPESTAPFLTGGLEKVVRLPQHFRHCFVLRILAGWPRQACTQMLRLNAAAVDQYTCAALQLLAGTKGTAQCFEAAVED